MCRSCGEICTTITTRRKHHHFGREAMNCTIIKVPRHNAGADAIGHDQIKREIFDEELRIVLERLAIKRVQYSVASAVSSSTAELYWRTITDILHMAVTWALRKDRKGVAQE